MESTLLIFDDVVPHIERAVTVGSGAAVIGDLLLEGDFGGSLQLEGDFIGQTLILEGDQA